MDPAAETSAAATSPARDSASSLKRSHSDAAYADAARRVGEKTRVAVADLHAAFLAKGRGWEKALLSDGLHFNQQGQALAFETVFDAVPPEVRPDRFQIDAPTHDALVGNATDDWHGHLRDDFSFGSASASAVAA